METGQDWLNVEGDEVFGGRYWWPYFWEEPPYFVPMYEQVAAWSPAKKVKDVVERMS